jgi:hypothetical protein
MMESFKARSNLKGGAMAVLKFFGLGLAGWVCLFITACAFDLAHVNFDPVQIKAPIDDRSVTLREEVNLNDMPCGYSRKLRKDTTWKCIGMIDQGAVYKSVDQCLTVECSNVFEAYLVIQSKELTGFYLPVQDGYVALKKPVELPIY